jgi:uncharacterized protein
MVMVDADRAQDNHVKRAFGEPTGRREAAEQRRWADYSHAHGGKDGTPFPVRRDTYDRNIVALNEAVRRARLGDTEKFDALRRLARLGESDF